jgi:hypothetical protein
MSNVSIVDLEIDIQPITEADQLVGSGYGNGKKGGPGGPPGFGGGDNGFFFTERGPGNSRSSTFYAPGGGFPFGGGNGFFFTERGPGNSRSSTFYVPGGFLY